MDRSEYATERKTNNFSLNNVLSIISDFLIGVFNIKKPIEKDQKRELNEEIKDMKRMESDHSK